MALGRRLLTTGGGAGACLTETTDIFGDSSGVALYSLDYDASEASGSYDGTPSNVTFGVGGKINTGARFNGSSSKISLGSSFISAFDVSDRSLSLWFKWDGNTNSNGFGMPFWMTGPNLSNGRIGAQITYSTGQLLAFQGSAGSYPTTTVSANIWYHFAITVNSSSYEAFLNGSLIGTATNDQLSFQSADTAHIGSFNGSSGYFSGDIDQVRFFTTALSESQVNTLAAETACVHTATTTDNNYPTTNLAYYKLDNSAEDSKGTADGTETDIEYRFGRYGQAAVFNGSSSYIDTNLQMPSTTTFTFSAWVNTAGSVNQHIVGDFTSSATGATFRVQLASNNNISVGVGNGTNINYNSFGIISGLANTWKHIAVTVNGTSVKAYVDGVQHGTTFTSSYSLAAGSNDFVIGAFAAASGKQNFSGKIDQVRFFTSELIDTKVTQLFAEKPETDTSNFKAVLYEGTNATQYISNVGFQPDLTWIKNRDTTGKWHSLADSVRGGGKRLFSNETSAQSTDTYDTQSFEANGFIIGNGDYVSRNNESHVAWNWKAGGTPVTIGVNSITGSTPSIASTVSANPAAGFSIVRNTGTANYSDTIGHGLTQAPEIVIQKPVVNNVAWYVLFNIDGTGGWDYASLNTSAAFLADSPVRFAANSTTINNWGWTNYDMINYCWHSVAGYSSIGTYPGATAGVTKNIGFAPSVVIIKNATQSDPWGIFDNKRPSGTGFRSYLYPSTADDEDVYGGSLSGVTLTSTGFTINNTSSNMVNQNGETFLYMAFK